MEYLYINKAYDALDRNRCLNILAAYGMAPWAIRLLWWYWGWLAMVVQAEGYYAVPFKGFRGVT